MLVIDTQSARRDWGLGRIEATYPGKDGLVRVVDIRQNDKIRQLSRFKQYPLFQSEEAFGRWITQKR